MERILELLRLEGGVLARRDHRSLAAQLDHCLRAGRLCAPLPGVYTAPQPDWQVRVRAVAAFRRDAVITGAAAARLLWWPECPLATVTVAVPDRIERTYPGYRWEQRRIAADLIHDADGLRIAYPALSVLDLMLELGGEVIDEALRRRSVDLALLWDAVRQTPQRPGNAARRALLRDSRDEPWSEAERNVHRLLRAARMAGWVTNHRIVIDGVNHYADIAFPRQRVLVEIDGWEFHRSRESFVGDRWRYARFAAHNWTVLPFAAEAITNDPDEFVRLVRMALSG